VPKSNTAIERYQFDPNAVFTIEEAAQLLKVSPRRVRRWVYNGSIGYTLLPGGRGRRITGAHLNTALAVGDRSLEA
jgi:excisionase family DNA binding protein